MFKNLTKTPLIYSVSYLNFWGLELCFGGGAKLTKTPRGDGTGSGKTHAKTKMASDL